MTSMDPTTVDTIDADDANEIAAEDQDVTGGYRPMSGESDAADRNTTSGDRTPRRAADIAGETDGTGQTEDGDKQYPGD